MPKRGLDQLINKEQPAWPMLQEWFREAGNPVEVLPPHQRRHQVLLETQVTTRSPLGAVIYESGGILVDNGWLRLLGSGHEKLSSLPDLNRSIGCDLSQGPPFLLIAFDALGGPFVLDGGGLGRAGGVFYRGPESLQWADTELNYTEFLRFSLYGDLEAFYGELRWPGWQTDLVEQLGDCFDHGLLLDPPLNCDGPPVARRKRSVLPVVELFALHGVSANSPV